MAATRPLAVGLAGAGEWASRVHAPLWAAGPETRLAGVWSRRTEQSAQLAAAHGAPVFSSFEALVEASEAIVFALPPAVQAGLAPVAAACGRAVLLEKPLATDVDGAERVADAVDAAGVGSLMGLTYRFNPVVREFLRRAADFDVAGARACFLSGVFLAGRFGGTWREQYGALLDVGPHLLDLVQAAMGPFDGMTGRTSPGGWTSLVARHAVRRGQRAGHLLPRGHDAEPDGDGAVRPGRVVVRRRPSGPRGELQGAAAASSRRRPEPAAATRWMPATASRSRSGSKQPRKATQTPAGYGDGAASPPRDVRAGPEPAQTTARPERPAG